MCIHASPYCCGDVVATITAERFDKTNRSSIPSSHTSMSRGTREDMVVSEVGEIDPSSPSRQSDSTSESDESESVWGSEGK